MTFSEFAKKLFPIIGNGNSHSAFAKTLFESIISDDNGLAIIDGYSTASFKAYYSGAIQIAKFAKTIMKFTDKYNFSEFIKEFKDAPMEDICEAFENDIPNIDPFNAPDKLADLFYSIIKDAASTERNQHTPNQEIFDDEKDDDEPSGDSENGKKRTVIHQQTNVVQNGGTNISLTNNGTINFDVKGDF